MTTTAFNTKLIEVENNIFGNSTYITTQEFNKLTAERFLQQDKKQANLVSKTDYDNKLTSFNKQIASNKTKRLELKKKLNT